jgi:CRP-like cAMP-binding protein
MPAKVCKFLQYLYYLSSYSSRLQPLFHYIQTLSPLTSEAQTAIDESFEEIVLSKNDYLLNEGKTCKYLYFLVQGVARGYYILDGKEITHWFAFENDFVTSLHSFITGEPAVENIQVLEGSILYCISREKLRSLLNRFHEIERMVRIAYEKYYIRLEDRFLNAQFKTASERYDKLIIEAPHIVERVPLGMIASYLGISQETLSRVRGKK